MIKTKTIYLVNDINGNEVYLDRHAIDEIVKDDKRVRFQTVICDLVDPDKISWKDIETARELMFEYEKEKTDNPLNDWALRALKEVGYDC